MKVQVRQSVFETNSSSTHSMIITEKSLYEDWKAGKAHYNTDTGKIEPGKADPNHKNHWGESIDQTYDGWWEATEYFREDDFFDSYTTKSGETVVVLGCYGHD